MGVEIKLGSHTSCLLAYEDGTDTVFRNVAIQSTDVGESPRRKPATRINEVYFHQILKWLEANIKIQNE
jgi:hypothetical protein